MNGNLDMAERCAEISQTTSDTTLRSIFGRMSELYRQLHEEEEKLADWKSKQDPSSTLGFIFKKPRD